MQGITHWSKKKYESRSLAPAEGTVPPPIRGTLGCTTLSTCMDSRHAFLLVEMVVVHMAIEGSMQLNNEHEALRPWLETTPGGSSAAALAAFWLAGWLLHPSHPCSLRRLTWPTWQPRYELPSQQQQGGNLAQPAMLASLA